MKTVTNFPPPVTGEGQGGGGELGNFHSHL